MITNSTINKHFCAAETAALKLLESRARKILKDHPNLKEFVMANGSATFVRQNGDDIPLPFSFYADSPAYCEPVGKLLDEWDGVLHLTGTPMRFTATGKTITNW